MQPILITGEMRSGTTFLANFLNSQENMVVYADMFVTLFMEAHQLGINDIHRKLSIREKNVLFSNLIQEGLRQHISFGNIDRKDDLSWFQLFEKALLVLQGDDNPSIVGVKRTREEEYLPQLLEAGVKVIYCLRDPRDVVISASNRFASFDLFKAAEKWKQSVTTASNFQDNENFYILRYEDLILKKEEVAKALAHFLKYPVSTNLKQLKSGKNNTYLDNSSFGDISRLFDPKGVNRWRESSNKLEVGFCQFLLSEEMARNGYKLEKQTFSTQEHERLKELIRIYRRQKLKQKIVAPLRKVYSRWNDKIV